MFFFIFFFIYFIPCCVFIKSYTKETVQYKIWNFIAFIICNACKKAFKKLTKLFFYLTYIILFIMYGWYQASGKLSFIKIMMILFTINPTPPVKNKQSETKPQFSRCKHVNDSVYFIYNTQITLYSSRWYLHHILEKKKLCTFFSTQSPYTPLRQDFKLFFHFRYIKRYLGFLHIFV